MRVVLLFLLLSTVAWSQNVDNNSEHMSTDLLFLRSLYGQGPVGQYAVRPFTMSSVQSAPSNNDPELLRQIQQHLHHYYAPLLIGASEVDHNGTTPDSSDLNWLPKTDGRYHALWYGAQDAKLLVDVSAMTRVGSVSLADSSHSFVMANMSGRAMGSLSSSLGYMLYLSNGSLFKGDANYVKLTDPVLSHTLKFVELEQKFFDRYIGYLQYQSEHLRIRLGRENVSWGYSPIDNLVHSDYAAPGDGVFLDIPYKAIRFSSVHLAVDGIDTSGKAITSKYIASHRLQVEAASWLSIGVNDMVVYSGRGIDLSYLNPLAFYVSTGLTTRDKSEMDNSLIGVDAAIRPFNKTIVYAGLLLDDLSFSSLSDTTALGNNNKNAWQLGATHVFDETPIPFTLSAEYVRVSPFCYSHREINNAWTNLGAPLGYSQQPNSDRWAVQSKWWLNGRSTLQIDFDYTRWGENVLDSNGHIASAFYIPQPGDTLVVAVGNVGGDMTRGDGDFLPGQYAVGNKFLRGNLSLSRRVQATLSTELWSNVFVDARLLYQNRTGGNAPGSTFWTTVELRIGY